MMRKTLILLPLLWLATAAMAAPITYQGQLQDGSGPYTGVADMSFRLYDSLAAAEGCDEDYCISAWALAGGGVIEAESDDGRWTLSTPSASGKRPRRGSSRAGLGV